MGDMADYFLEQVEDSDYYTAVYHAGGLSDIEAMDRGIIDEHP